MILGSIVLAGGPSSRMGTSKAALAWGDGSMLLHVVTTLLDCTYPVVVVGRDDHQDLPPMHTECDLVFDERPGQGALHAIETGMLGLDGRCDAVFVTACDMPFISSRAIAWLTTQLGEHAGVVPIVGGTPQPLAGIYRTSLLPAIRALVKRGAQRATDLVDLPGVHRLAESEVRKFDPELRFTRDLDTTEDYQQALRESGF